MQSVVPPFPPVAVEVLRGDRVESAHRVHLVVADAAGGVVRSLGDPAFRTFLRSAAKPFQAAALVESGAADRFGVTEEELALATGSHAGEARHVQVARSMLARGGFESTALGCGTHAFWTRAGRALGEKPSVLHNNCSGKHAAFLLLARHLGQDPATYLDPEGAAQQRVRALVAEVAGVPSEEIGVAVDGCGAPTFSLTIAASARLFAQLSMPRGVSKQTEDALRRVAAAMARHTSLVGGTGRFDTDLMDASEDRLVAKAGAEGSQGVADLASGLGLFLKVEDGAHRAVGPATVEALRQLAWLEGRAFEVLGEWWMPPVTNHAGRVVGSVRPVLTLVNGTAP